MTCIVVPSSGRFSTPVDNGTVADGWELVKGFRGWMVDLCPRMWLIAVVTGHMSRHGGTIPVQQTKLQQVIDRLFAELYGQPLGDWVRDLREQGTPWRRIEKELFAKTNGAVDVSHATLVTWYGDVDSKVVA
jgi:hypothetical protein